VSVVVLHVIRVIVGRLIGRWAKRTESDLDDLFVQILGQTKTLFILILSINFGTQILTLPEKIHQIINTGTVITVFIQLGFWGNGIITHWVSRRIQVEVDDADAERATTMNILGYVAKVVLWAVVLILALDNIPGVEVDSLIASLGIGGVAVALAVQNILGDLFASVSIALDKPFVIGDFIIIDDYLGTVERIGLNSTRIRSLSGEELVFSNSDLVKSRIMNFGNMERRRVQFNLGVAAETPNIKLKAIPDMIKEIIESNEKTTFDRAHFKEFGEYALSFEVVYYVEGPDHSLYMDIQQSINLAIHSKFEEEGIEMPYPTQKIYSGVPAQE
jgi:small-conductance mechanosensitive channel